MINIAGISIALFISALLLNKKNKSKSDIFLLIWMLLMAIHLLLFYISFNDNIYNSPYLLGIEIPLPLLHGVFLYYYVSSVTNQFPKKNWVALLHLAPATIGYIYLISFFRLPTEQKIEFYNNNAPGYEIFMNIGLVLIFLSGTIYVIWSIILLRKHRKNIYNEFSDVKGINLKWLKFLTYGLGLIWCIVIFTNNDFYIFLGVSLFTILIGFFGVQQRTIFINQNHALKNNNKAKKEKYASSGLKAELADDLYKNLIQLMTENEYYKQNDLSLNDLASELNINPNYLSQIINEKEKKSFYDFINTFRVEEFKRLIKVPENQQFTLLAIAYDCGFNSKSSFNRYFKKNTGKTPSQYANCI